MNEKTIRITSNLHKALNKVKALNERFEEFIWDLVEPFFELSAESKKDIENSLEDYKKGKVYSLKEVKKELNI